MRASDVDIIHIEADPRLEAPEWILLADTADESDQRRVTAARDLQGEVGYGLLQDGDVGRAELFEISARKRADRDGHVLQGLRASPGRDGDFFECDGARLCPRRCGEQADRGGSDCERHSEREAAFRRRVDAVHRCPLLMELRIG